MFKKFMSLFVILTLLISFNAAAQSVLDFAETSSLIVNFSDDYKADDDVTFIVEVEGEPLAASLAANDYSQILEKQVIETQTRVMSSITRNVKRSAKKGFTYTTVFNGFSVDAKYKDMDAIKAIPGVKNVYISQSHKVVRPMLTSSPEMTGTQYVYDTLGYKGEKQVIAIIDSEFDTSHTFFEDSPPDNPKYSKEDIADILANNTLNVSVSANQVYKNPKIPFAYDYAVGNSDTYSNDPDVIHGTHVAGIVAGKDATLADGSTLSGVAPEAQLILMKVTGDDGTFKSDALIAAMNDVVKFGVSALNLSLGIDYRPSALDNIYSECVNKLRNLGVLVSVAAGNSSRGFLSKTPTVENIDYSSAGVPSSVSASTSVASATNGGQTFFVGNFILNDNTKIPYALAYNTSGFASEFKNKNIEYVYCGYGTSADFASLDLTDKIALIRRGQTSFVDMVSGASACGAVGIIIISTGNSYTQTEDVSFPVATVMLADGITLEQAQTKSATVTDVRRTNIPLSGAGKVSYFSSWATSETLELKPEITAIGGSVYSSVPDDKYKTFSGTSMAAPQITGVAALMNQYYDTNPFLPQYNALNDSARVSMIENLIMSTADVIYSSGDIPSSPRVQGAGLINVRAAMQTPVVLIGKGGKTKISLGDKIGNEFTLDFLMKNLTDESVTYTDVSLDVLTDGYTTKSGQNYVGGMKRLKFSSDLPETVTLAPGEVKTMSVTVTLNADELAQNELVFTNGFYIDGFINFANENSRIGMPFTGFHGDWLRAPIFDTTMYDENASSLYDPDVTGALGTFAYTKIGSSIIQLGGNIFANIPLNEKYISVSPNGDGDSDTLNMFIQPLRSVGNITSEIYDENGISVDVFEWENKIAKYSGSLFEEIPSVSSLDDGRYTIKFSGEYIEPYENENYIDEFILPFTVDTKKPEITSVSLKNNLLSITATDENYVQGIMLQGKTEAGYPVRGIVPFDYADNDSANKIATATFNVEGLNAESIVINAVDYASNMESGSIGDFSNDVRAEFLDLRYFEGITVVELSIKNRTDEDIKNAKVMVAFYDEFGRLMQVAALNKTLISGEDTPATFRLLEDIAGAKTLKWFVWDSYLAARPLSGGNFLQLVWDDN